MKRQFEVELSPEEALNELKESNKVILTPLVLNQKTLFDSKAYEAATRELAGWLLLKGVDVEQKNLIADPMYSRRVNVSIAFEGIYFSKKVEYGKAIEHIYQILRPLAQQTEIKVSETSRNSTDLNLHVSLLEGILRIYNYDDWHDAESSIALCSDTREPWQASAEHVYNFIKAVEQVFDFGEPGQSRGEIEITYDSLAKLHLYGDKTEAEMFAKQEGEK